VSFDPFADDAPTSAPNPTQTTNAWDTPAPTQDAVGLDGQRVRVTLKAGSGYEAPWITIDGRTVGDALDQISDAGKLRELMDGTLRAGAYFIKAHTGAAPAPTAGAVPPATQPHNGQPPQAAQEAPGGEKRYCAHGTMIYRTGISSKTGQPYKVFSCSHPVRNEQCKAQFIN
jgi:hypothetical protein